MQLKPLVGCSQSKPAASSRSWRILDVKSAGRTDGVAVGASLDGAVAVGTTDAGGVSVVDGLGEAAADGVGEVGTVAVAVGAAVAAEATGDVEADGTGFPVRAGPVDVVAVPPQAMMNQ